MLTIEKNKVFCNGHTFLFKYDVLEAEWVNQKLLVVFHPNEPGCSEDNVYCFSPNQELIWRIGKPPETMGSVRMPYVGIAINSKNCGAVDFSGRRFIIDVDTGTIIGMEFVK